MSETDPEDERGYWTITLEGGPATAANLATTLRSMIPRSWPGRVTSMAGFVERLASALDQAQFAPAREITLHRRDPVPPARDRAEDALRGGPAAMSSPPDPGPAYEPQVMPPLTMPTVLCHEISLIEDSDFWLHVKVIAEPTIARPWPFPVRADLGRRIVEMIKADIEADRPVVEGAA